MKSLPQKLEVFYLEGSDNCYLKLNEIINRSKSKLYVASGSLQILENVYEELSKVRLRGVTDVKLVIQKDLFGLDHKNSSRFQKFLNLGDIRITPFMFGTMVLIDDGKDSFFAYKKFLFTDGSLTGLFSENPVVGSIMREWFNYIFNEAKEA
jgi:hypothetical protein